MRYDARTQIIDESDLYKKARKKRDVKIIRHYETPVFKMPTEEEEASLEIIEHVWKLGDRYYKMAHQYYGDARLWWVIAWFNQKPTESHVSLGDALEVPFPLEKVLEYYDI